MTQSITVFLLLVLAAAAGWLVARIQALREIKKHGRMANDYFRGLNFLLNEEPDKAIDIFLELAEKRTPSGYRVRGHASSEVVDTHMALGSLFRRRGEMDKAIRFHKHIIAQPQLTDRQRTQALRELARDYLQAGLLDRAERLFSELVDRESGDLGPAHQLLDIYQQEKDWDKAIDQALKLQVSEPQYSASVLAHFYCELAQQALSHGDEEGALKSLRQARRYQATHPRASLIEGDLAWRQGQPQKALTAYQKACELDPESFVLVGDTMLAAAESLSDQQQLLEWLLSFCKKNQQTAAFTMAAQLMAVKNPQKAVKFLLDALEARPTIRGLEALVKLLHDQSMTLAEVSPDLIGELMMRLRQAQARYRCKECGFSGSEHHWLCPSCRHWDTTRLVQGPWGD